MKPCSTAPKAMPIYPGPIGKVAVVTGACSEIGAETARYLAANMVTLVVNSRNRDKLNKLAAGAQVGVIHMLNQFFPQRIDNTGPNSGS
jgi:NADP-dependent 3-hydroxy acid dehydrogenase YdfG